MAVDTTPEWGGLTLPLSLGFFEETTVHSVESVLSLTDEARAVERYLHVAHTLSLVSSGDYARDKPLSASDTLAMVQELRRVLTANEADALSLDSIVNEFNYVADRQPVYSPLNLSQTVFSSSSAPIEHVLALTDEAIGIGPYRVAVTHWIAFTQTLPTPHRLWVEDTLAFSQLLPTPLSGNATDTLVLVDEASITNLFDELNLTQSVVGARVYEPSHTMNLVSEVSVTSNFVRSLTQNLGIGHAMTWFRDDPCDRKNYTPFQGDQTVNTTFDPPPATIPSTPHDASTDRLVLYYPSIDAIARQLTLRAPEFQDRDRNSYTRVTRETRGGSLVVYADPEWPSLRNVAVTVQGLTANEADDYLTFMYATLGKKIQVRDWEGGLWEGVIINPENPVTQDGPGCKYTISFELEGLKFETDNWTEEADLEGFVLNLEDEATVVKVTP